MLDRLTPEDFAPFIGQDFHVAWDETADSLTLVEIQRFGAAPAPGFRVPFILLFEGANRDVMMPQAIRTLENQRMGRLEVLVTPAMPTADRNFRYQVVFG